MVYNSVYVDQTYGQKSLKNWTYSLSRAACTWEKYKKKKASSTPGSVSGKGESQALFQLLGISVLIDNILQQSQ